MPSGVIVSRRDAFRETIRRAAGLLAMSVRDPEVRGPGHYGGEISAHEYGVREQPQAGYRSRHRDGVTAFTQSLPS
ncbi:hypothetical protein GCM10010102_01370 [Promicromonospora citrea]|uniref:Uncharacterized protein n=1 Tax=Promicromonospora citrea TaxID=43677 RepID=A0A8H9GEB8_9MICO|nr:hypothetical protein GCM10010102_01370 [Promicromonospora citrea]